MDSIKDKLIFSNTKLQIKTLCSFICIVLLGMLSSCEKNVEKAQYKIGFSQCTGGDDWRKAMHAEMEREMSFHPNLELIIKDAAANTSRQIDQINELVASSIDLLIVSPNEAEPITSVIEAVLKQDIPVIIVDRKTNSPFYTAYVGADNFEIGKTAGIYSNSLLPQGGKVLEIWGLQGSSPAKERHEGFQASIRSNPQMTMIGELHGQWTEAGCQAALEAFYQGAHEIPNLVFSHNDVMAQAAYQFFKQKKQHEDILFLGVDGLGGNFGGMQLVAEGLLEATFLYPTGGEEAIRIAARILAKESFDKENILQTTVINSSNVNVMQMQTDRINSQQKNIERQESILEEQRKIYQDQQTILYVVLGSLLIAIILGGLTLKALREKQEANRLLEQQNDEIVTQRNQIMQMAEQTREATQAKFAFFTNISHEFRTPLTLILGPLDDLLSNNQLATKDRHDLKLIRKNAMRLLRLINQLMDFRKIEHGKMKLQAADYDIISFCREIFSSFERMAKDRLIDYTFSTELSELACYFDRDKLDKVLFNLLSNAFKFTKDKGKISFSVSKSGSEAVINVKDNGRGMSPEHVAHAFDRFYQGESYQAKGTGLGLSLSQELIQLHHGKIEVQSEKWKGTCFEIRLPLGDAHLVQDEKLKLGKSGAQIDEDAVLYVETSDRILSDDLVNSEQQKGTTHAYSILIVEDNPQLRNFLYNRLVNSYNIILAKDGHEGQKMALKWIPDLIISDWVLPKQDGLSLSTSLKQDLKTSHIPIIMLTAKSDTESRILGMKSGADVYISKPFSSLLLEEQILSLLRNREILKARYTTEISLENPTAPSNLSDRKFLNALTAKIEENLGNSSFSVQDLGQEMGMSRVQLYRKVKALLDIGVSDYIKMARLKKAAQLLQETELSMAEIAYQSGFSSPAYFSTAFKAQYQISPTEFRAKAG